ncbi:protocadherin-18-like isoform X3 [Octopus sinensis]|uniref:Protocadherin-18-like isoform X3 n=1 Tax=Octopus sinensis TaxID=2607531 RepID=A0A7E6FC59_9MOLL|nr:protocadherin-18-like isoform X3 [Octopus sinensis]
MIEILEAGLLFSLLYTLICAEVIFRVKENQNIDSKVGDIAHSTQFLDSLSRSETKQIWFSRLKQGTDRGSELFNVSKSGTLYTAKELDAESLCKYNTDCFKMVEVAVRKKESFIKIIEIKVFIEDINDNKPEFPSEEIHIKFSERDSKGSKISIPNAIDKDMASINSQINYQLRKYANEPFTLSVTKKRFGSSKLEIMLEKKLDREVKDKYLVQIIAIDEGYPPMQSVLNVHINVTDVNDNPPVFSQNIYNVSVSTKHRRDTPIVILSATDNDLGQNGKVSYFFGSKTANIVKTCFELKKSTGEIFLLKTPSLAQKQVQILQIEAKDGGNPPLSSTAMVIVNLVSEKNNAPVIDMNFISESRGNVATISEGIEVGSFIAYVKITDNDVGSNGEVSCSLHHNILLLQSLGRKKYKILVKNRIDREEKSNIDFTITCKDKASPPMKTQRRFSIQVMDVNDEKPQFTKDTFKFLTYENEKPNFPVGFINATDPDLGLGGQLIYSLFSKKNQVVPFKISNFGFISTLQPLDREKQNIYEFQALVRDSGIPLLNNTTNVIIEVMDENDNAPYFTFPSVNPFNLDIHYEPQSNNDVTTLRASDRDSHVNAFLRYEIIGGNHKQLFIINPYTGVLSFSRPVYQNDAGSYDLQFVVRDSGTPVLSATTTVFLTLTVSNSTSQLYTAQHTESDDMIHISLVVIIVIAAVIISTAIVVSIIVCIVQRQNQREVQYGYRTDTNNEFIGDKRQSECATELMCPEYDVPVPILKHPCSSQSSKVASLRKESQTEFNQNFNYEGATSDFQLKTVADSTYQIMLHKLASTEQQQLPYNSTAGYTSEMIQKQRLGIADSLN